MVTTKKVVRKLRRENFYHMRGGRAYLDLCQH